MASADSVIRVPVPASPLSPVSAPTMVVVPPVLLISLLLSRLTLVRQRSIDHLQIVFLALGSTSWLGAGRRWGDWQVTSMVAWALVAGLVAAGIAVGVWYFHRVSAETGKRRWLHVPVFVLSVVFSLTLGSLMVWSVAATT